MNHAVINKAGEVVNVIWWEGAPWTPPEGCTVVKSDIMGIGDKYDNDKAEITKADGRVYNKDTKIQDYLDAKAILRQPDIIAEVTEVVNV